MGKGPGQSYINLFNIHLLYTRERLGLEELDLGSFWENSTVEHYENVLAVQYVRGMFEDSFGGEDTLQRV